MRTQFPLFCSHLDLAHDLWRRLITPDDAALDATCGQGYDSLFLASLGPRLLYVFDIQNQALEKTRAQLKNSSVRCEYHELCHSKIGTVIPKESLKLVVYNLGYLPGTDKQIKTQSETTIASVECALDLLLPEGAISITCYPGHPEGAKEEAELVAFSKSLAPSRWCVCFHQFLNRKASPSLLLIQKSST